MTIRTTTSGLRLPVADLMAAEAGTPGMDAFGNNRVVEEGHRLRLAVEAGVDGDGDGGAAGA